MRKDYVVIWTKLKKKLLSRKLWVSLSSFVSMLMLYFNAPQETAESVASLIMAGASLMAYVIGEGLADGTNSSVNVPHETIEVNVKLPDSTTLKLDGDVHVSRETL